MATASNPGNVQETSSTNTTSVGSPISNEAYNVITALQAKLEGLEAYRKYQKDQGAELWSQLSRIEIEAVDRLCSELERLVRDGKLRMEQGSRH